jgi:hypothetical protein
MCILESNRPYNDAPYLLIKRNPFYYRMGLNNQTISCFVYQKMNTFGDPAPLVLAGLTIKFQVYDSHGNLVLRKTANVSDFEASEIEYVWNSNDLKKNGYYTGEFIFTDIDDTQFVLPELNQRIQIICKN